MRSTIFPFRASNHLTTRYLALKFRFHLRVCHRVGVAHYDCIAACFAKGCSGG